MFLIRRYRDSDHDEVWALHNLALEPTGAHIGNGPWDDDLHNIPEVYLNNGGEFLVGEYDGKVVAMGAFKRTGPDRAEIKRMRVHPDYQRRGFGQTILYVLEARALRIGYRVFHLDTTVKQTAAQELYRKWGYREVGRTVRGGLETILLERQLR